MKYRRKFRVLISLSGMGMYSTEIMARNIDVARMFIEKRLAPYERIVCINEV